MSDLPTIRASQAACLVGKPWFIDGRPLRFGEFRAGGEAFVCPLINDSGEAVYFLRFLNSRFITPERIHRTAWLIGQRFHAVSDLFIGVPRCWTSTLTSGRPPGVNFEFTATVHAALPGRSWRDIKLASSKRGSLPSHQDRIALAKELIAHLAALESIGFVHGDLSDGNLLLSRNWRQLTIIDFDAFVYHHSTTLGNPSLSISKGGVTGTTGYCPRDLENATLETSAPYSDRHARDMLLLEFLGFLEGDPPDSSPKFWANKELTFEAVTPVAQELGLNHLCEPRVYSASEQDRPSSQQLASGLGLSLESSAGPFCNRPVYPPIPIRTDAVSQPRSPSQSVKTKQTVAAKKARTRPSCSASYTSNTPSITSLIVIAFLVVLAVLSSGPKPDSDMLLVPSNSILTPDSDRLLYAIGQRGDAASALAFDAWYYERTHHHPTASDFEEMCRLAETSITTASSPVGWSRVQHELLRSRGIVQQVGENFIYSGTEPLAEYEATKILRSFGID